MGTGPAFPHGGKPGKDLNRAKNRDGHAGRAEKTHRHERHSDRKHVVYPNAKPDYASEHRCNRDVWIADDGAAAEYGNDHRNHAGRRQEDDINPRVAKKPEQLLPQQDEAAVCNIEEMKMPPPVELEKHTRDGQRG